MTSHSRSSNLAYEPCRREKLVFFAAAKSRVAAPEISLAELAKIPLAIYKRGRIGATAKFFQRMEKAGLKPNIAFRCETVEAVKTAVRAGGVLGMLYRDNLITDIARGEVELIRVAGEELRIESTIVYSRRRPLSPAAEALLQILRAAQPVKTAARAESRRGRVRAVSILSLAPLLLCDYIYPVVNFAGDWLGAAAL